MRLLPAGPPWVICKALSRLSYTSFEIHWQRELGTVSAMSLAAPRDVEQDAFRLVRAGLESGTNWRREFPMAHRLFHLGTPAARFSPPVRTDARSA